MPQRRLSLYILLSVLLHILMLLIFASGLIRLPSSQTEVDNGETTLTLLQEAPLPPPSIGQVSAKPQSIFIPTLPSQETDKPNANALLQSERNTALRTDSPHARNPNSPLPDISGNKHSNSWVNSPASAGQSQQPPAQASNASKQSLSPQLTQAQPQQQPTQPKPVPPQQEQAQTPPQPAKPTPPTPRVDDAIAVLPPETPKPSQQVAQQSPASANSPQQASRPPPASFAATRADISGSRGLSGAPSPEARDTELGRYKQKMYRAVGSCWYLKTQSSMSFLSIGSVRIKFFVRANGVLENLRIVVDSGTGNNSTEMLRTISMQSLVESAPFEPFSETMKQQLGAGYDEEFTFSIY